MELRGLKRQTLKSKRFRHAYAKKGGEGEPERRFLLLIKRTGVSRGTNTDSLKEDKKNPPQTPNHGRSKSNVGKSLTLLG